MNVFQEKQSRLRPRIALVFAGALTIAACASTPVAPTAALDAAQAAISDANRAEAARYAPDEMSEAHSKLASADTAVTEKKMVMAERLAEESRTEAVLASARTEDAKAKAVNLEMQHSTGTLIEEMQRNAGDKQ